MKGVAVDRRIVIEAASEAADVEAIEASVTETFSIDGGGRPVHIRILQGRERSLENMHLRDAPVNLSGKAENVARESRKGPSERLPEGGCPVEE